VLLLMFFGYVVLVWMSTTQIQANIPG